MTGAAIAVLLIVLVFLAPPLLFGQALSAFGLLIVSGSVLVVGLLLRNASPSLRAVGSILVVIGALSLALAGRLTALLLAGWGRGY